MRFRYKPEKTRTTVVESSKIAGGLVGDALGSALVIGLDKGGTGLVVLGVAAGASVLLGTIGSEVGGMGAEYLYDKASSKK